MGELANNRPPTGRNAFFADLDVFPKSKHDIGFGKK